MIVNMYNTLLSNIINNPENSQYRKITTTKLRLMETVFMSDKSRAVLELTGWMTVDSR